MSEVSQVQPRYLDQVRPRYISRVQKCISTFISHNSEDNAEARYYEDLLQGAGFSAFQYGHGLDPGASIQRVVRARIKESHFFLFIVSDYSMQSEWVQRELGLAIHERNKSNGIKPVIIPAFAEKAVWRRSNRRPSQFPVRDFETERHSICLISQTYGE
jgi:hypothetical protein